MLKNYKLKAFALLLLAGSVLGSCDYLDIAPAEIMTEDKIFQDITLAQQDLGSMYHDIIKWTALNSDDRLLGPGVLVMNQLTIGEQLLLLPILNWVV